MNSRQTLCSLVGVFTFTFACTGGCGNTDFTSLLSNLGLAIDINANTDGDGSGNSSDGRSDDGIGGTDGSGMAANMLSTDLTGAVGSNGQAAWSVRIVQTEFKVEIESGTPNNVLDIVVDGVMVGQLTLNGAGFGELKFRDPPDDNPGLNEFPFPANFPSPLMEGSVVAVGDLEGTLAAVAAGGAGTNDGAGTGAGDGAVGGGSVLTSLAAVFTGQGGFGNADWEVRSDRTSFNVEVESGTPGAKLNVVVDGVTVWQLTLDATGFGEVEFRDPPDNNPADNEFPFPDNFPAAVGVGTVVNAGSLTGKLQPVP